MSDLIIDILERNFKGPRYHSESNSQITFDCPLCSQEKGLPEGDGKGNLEVNYEKKLFKCWACHQRNGMSGSLKKLLNWFGSNKDVEEYEKLVPRSDLAKWNAEKPSKEKEIKRVRSLPPHFKPLRGEYLNTDIGNRCSFYLKEGRGIDEDTVRKYNIGYADGGMFQGRMIIPSYDRKGDVNYFVTRAFGNARFKYLNPSADKEEIIFNEYFIKYDFPIYLVEGVFDHLVTPNSIPLLGTEMSDKLFEKLYDNSSSYIIIFLDGDAYSDAMDLYYKLNVGRLGGKIRIVRTRKDYDPSKLHKEVGTKTFFKALSKSFTL